MHESFLSCRNFVFLKLAAGLSGLSLLAYAINEPGMPANGGTVLGYTLGTVGALLIVWLLWFGVRKRQYNSTFGTLSEWLSGHVYLGSSLIVIASLHCGFQFGWNVHTLAYVLMLVVIVSGFFGVAAYVRYPRLMANNRDRKDLETLLVEIGELDEDAIRVAGEVSDDAHRVVLQMIEGTNFNPQFATRAKEAIDNSFGNLLQSINRKVASITRIGSAKERSNPESTTIIKLGGKTVVVDMGDKNDAINRLFELLGTRNQLVKRVQRDIRFHRLLRQWLYVHIPFSIALVATLVIHIVSVLFYW